MAKENPGSNPFKRTSLKLTLADGLMRALMSSGFLECYPGNSDRNLLQKARWVLFYNPAFRLTNIIDNGESYRRGKKGKW